MYDSGIFVFGSKLFQEPFRDAITHLPLELSWRIFAYLDDGSLRNASHAFKTWKRIIIANKTLRSRLNLFELAFKLGSEKLARFSRRHKKMIKKSMTTKNFIPVAHSIAESTTHTICKSKRGGEDLVICVKRYKLF